MKKDSAHDIQRFAFMKRTISRVMTVWGIVVLILLLLAVLMFFFGRRYVKPLLPESLGGMLFPPLATPVIRDDWQIFTPDELPETPSSIIRAARQWADDRGWEFGDCERHSSSLFREIQSPDHLLKPPVYDDPDYATCLHYVRTRAVDRDSENAIPGQWLPGRVFGDQARRDFEAILARRPDFFYAAWLLGCWHRQNGDMEEASQYFEQAYTAAPIVLVMSFDLFELPESWEQNRPPRVTLVNNRTLTHSIDLTYHYGMDDCAMVRYPLLQADENGLVLIPAESGWLTWERTYYTGRRGAAAIDMPAVERPNRKFDTAWRFRGRSKVALLQHVEIIPLPYDANPMRSDPFFDPVWGVQQSLGVYERVASYCEGQNEPSFLYERRTLTPGQCQYLPPGGWQRTASAGFMLTESGTIRPIGGAKPALIDSRDSRLLTWFLQQTGMTRNTLIAKTQAWHAEHAPDAEIMLPHNTGLIMTVVDRDHAVWLVKLAPASMFDDASADAQPPCYTATTLRIGSFPKNHELQQP